jgi:ParB-like chromosome segregation protein Spo0J
LPPVQPQKVYKSPLLEARRYENLLKYPFIKTQSDIAREMGISRARVSQIMALLKLAPEIQRELLALQEQRAIRFFSERRLRPLLNIKEPLKQIQEFNKMKGIFQSKY